MLCSLYRTHAILLQNAIRERKGIFLVQTASDKKAAGDIAVIGEKRKRRFQVNQNQGRSLFLCAWLNKSTEAQQIGALKIRKEKHLSTVKRALKGAVETGVEAMSPVGIIYLEDITDFQIKKKSKSA